MFYFVVSEYKTTYSHSGEETYSAILEVKNKIIHSVASDNIAEKLRGKYPEGYDLAGPFPTRAVAREYSKTFNKPSSAFIGIDLSQDSEITSIGTLTLDGSQKATLAALDEHNGPTMGHIVNSSEDIRIKIPLRHIVKVEEAEILKALEGGYSNGSFREI